MTNGAAIKHILVIDNEPAARALICEYLNREGLRADACGSLDQAVKLLCTENYDLATLDLPMPWMDGGGLQGLISVPSGHTQRLPDLLPPGFPPMVIVTGCAQDPWVADLLDGENVVGVLAKPLSYESFSLTVRRILIYLEARKRTHTKMREPLREHVFGRGKVGACPYGCA